VSIDSGLLGEHLLDRHCNDSSDVGPCARGIRMGEFPLMLQRAGNGKLQPPTRTGSSDNTSATQNSKLKRPFMADCSGDILVTRAITCKISDFGFEMQDSSDFKIS